MATEPIVRQPPAAPYSPPPVPHTTGVTTGVPVAVLPPASAHITWLGEGDNGPKTNVWNGITFEVGKAVEVSDPAMIAKARTNRFYKVG